MRSASRSQQRIFRIKNAVHFHRAPIGSTFAVILIGVRKGAAVIALRG
jgi:hypothetical protein